MRTSRNLKEGKIISIPCTISQGVFTDEKFVRIDVPNARPITAFIPSKYIEDPEPSSDKPHLGKVPVIVARVTKAEALLFIPGESLSHSNPIPVPIKWLKEEGTVVK